MAKVKTVPKKGKNKTRVLNIKSKISTTSDFPIVGIGASAGGLEALEQFFKNMPDGNGMAFVVIQHLDPNHVGLMPELLQRITSMKVLQASDKLIVKPNSIYVIPPNKSMSVLNRALYLFEPVESHGLRLPIDIFFNSLAEDRQEKSIGIVLSGMGSDGTKGLKSIKEKNGIVVVQDPATAQFDSMPRNAANAVLPDIIANAGELPAKLINFLKFIPAIKNERGLEYQNKSNFDKIRILIREQSGHDFSLYKKSTLLRRIERRMAVHQLEKIQDYIIFLQVNPKEAEILFKELLIGVTNFFRDVAVWDKLKSVILPVFLNELPDGYNIRAWVTGCSTGEEAYSLAIVFKEALDNLPKKNNLSLQIFATDLDSDAIEKARKGFFHSNIANDVSAERLKKFFTHDSRGYNVNTVIREMVVFAPHNVIKDPPFTKLDILFCRNMMIYFEHELQKKLFSLFNYCLRPKGLMVIGLSETLVSKNEFFTELDANLKIFKCLSNASSYDLTNFPSSFYHSASSATEIKMPLGAVENIQALADQILLQHFAPASALLNSKGDILYITGRTGKYLEPVSGKANWNIYAMARDGLRQVLPSAFHKAMQSFHPVIINNIKIGINGGTQFIDVTVKSIDKPDSMRGMFMIVFSDVPAVIENKNFKHRTSAHQKELQIELQRCYEELQTTREEMQSSQEELKSINEELQSTNEELQSTNEELTTSKEEMQSLNEELRTVNYELQSKVNDYIRTNEDMENLLNTTEIAVLFLDKDLNIRRFTDQVANIIKLRDTDVGRPFTDLVTDLKYPEIDKHARQVIKTLVSVESENMTKDDRWFNVRIMPYRTLDDRIDGLVITFSDITRSKKLEIEMKKVKEEYR